MSVLVFGASGQVGRALLRLRPDFVPVGRALADLAVSSLAPVTAEMRRLMDDPAEIDRVLKGGAERAAEVADPVVDEVKKIVGFWRG